jgi:hypothetical protein
MIYFVLIIVIASLSAFFLLSHFMYNWGKNDGIEIGKSQILKENLARVNMVLDNDMVYRRAMQMAYMRINHDT